MNILNIDPSGDGTSGICLIIDGEIKEFSQFKSISWERHVKHFIHLIKIWKIDTIVYEYATLIKTKGRQMTSLFKLFGGIETLKFFFKDLSIFKIHNSQIKNLGKELRNGEVKIDNLFKKSNRWYYNDWLLSVHTLDSFLVFYLFSEKYYN